MFGSLTNIRHGIRVPLEATVAFKILIPIAIVSFCVLLFVNVNVNVAVNLAVNVDVSVLSYHQIMSDLSIIIVVVF